MKTHLIAPEGSVHHESFYPQRDAFNEAAADLAPDRNLLLAPHLCPTPIHKDWILFNAEQIGCGIGADPRYIELLRNYEVWDYSKLNIAELAKFGIKAKHCTLGYSPCLERISPNEGGEDVDVLFYGSINERRKKILLELQSKCKLHVSFGVYGKPLDDLIARSKIILNMHFYETAIHEITRTSYLMANRKFVVSEVGRDEELEAPYKAGMAFCEYGDLVAGIMYYLASPIRQEIADIGHRTFKVRGQREGIEGVLAA